MSESADGGESGGVAGAGQDAEADNEPPQQALHLSEDKTSKLPQTLEEGAPPTPKRPKMSEEQQELGRTAETVEMVGEAAGQSVLLQEDLPLPAQGRVY